MRGNCFGAGSKAWENGPCLAYYAAAKSNKINAAGQPMLSANSWQSVMSIEYERNGKDNLAEIAQSVGYLRGYANLRA